MTEERSDFLVCDDGELMNKIIVKEMLFKYWELSKAEKRCFDRLRNRSDLKEQYLEYKKQQP